MTAIATWNGTEIARADDYEVVENNVYFPEDTVHKEYLNQSDHTTTCPWKGHASYYDVVVDGERNENAAWTYKEPKPAAKNVAGHIAFWNGVHVEQNVAETNQEPERTGEDVFHRTVSTKELLTWYENQEDFLIIDVLPHKYFRKRHLPNAVNVELENIRELLPEIADKNRRIVLYCFDEDCKKSPHIAKKLEEDGFSNLYDYEPGVKGWEAAGNPTASR